MKNKNEIEKRLDKLEEYVCDEMESIRKLAKELPKEKDLFSITTYKEVCELLKEKEETCPYKKIKQIEKLYNGDWKKDWNNFDQRKHYPYFNFKASLGVVGFNGSYDAGYYSHGQVAFYKDQKTSDYVGKTFWLIYKEFIEN